MPSDLRVLTDDFQPELEGVRFLGILVQVLKIPAQCPRAPWCGGGAPLSHTHIHAAAGPRSSSVRIDGSFDRFLQIAPLESSVIKSIDSVC